MSLACGRCFRLLPYDRGESSSSSNQKFVRENKALHKGPDGLDLRSRCEHRKQLGPRRLQIAGAKNCTFLYNSGSCGVYSLKR